VIDIEATLRQADEHYPGLREKLKHILASDGPGLLRKKWTLVNHKGGVGKSHATMALAWALAYMYGLHVLVVDMDPQANTTRRAGYGATDTRGVGTLTEALAMNVEGCAEGIVLPCTWEELKEERDGMGSIDILPSRLDLEKRSEEGGVADAAALIRRAVQQQKPSILADIDVILKKVVGKLERPRQRLAKILGGTFLDAYDIVLMDCPPSLGLLTQMAYAASEGVLLCTNATFDSVDGAVRAQQMLHQTRTDLGNPTLDVLGVLLNDLQIVNSRDRAFGASVNAQESIKELQAHLGGVLWEPFMERRSSIAFTNDYGVSPITSMRDSDARYVASTLSLWGARLLEVSIG
jgi:cellulose biosynthesis protein BcsQ